MTHAHRNLAPSAAAAIAACALALAAAPASADAQETAADPAKVERGRYLVTTSACHDCHTPMKMGPEGPEQDMTRMLSGHPADLVLPPPPPMNAEWNMVVGSTMTAWRGDWGTSFTANLTPDPETGLGRWTLQNFKDTIRTGRHMGRGRPVLPPMPIPMYKHFNDADLEAIWAFLRSIPPIENRVPEPLPPPEAQ